MGSKSQQSSVDLKTMEETISTNLKGRHDACVVPRAVPIVEAYAAIVMADHSLRQEMSSTYLIHKIFDLFISTFSIF